MTIEINDNFEQIPKDFSFAIRQNVFELAKKQQQKIKTSVIELNHKTFISYEKEI